MSKANPFPKTIHVTIEEEGTKDEYLSVLSGGVDDSYIDETTTVAVYQLVEVGQVTVTRSFTAGAKARRGRSRTT